MQIGPLLIATRGSLLLVFTDLLSFNIFATNSSCLLPVSSLSQLLLQLVPQALAFGILAIIAGCHALISVLTTACRGNNSAVAGKTVASSSSPPSGLPRPQSYPISAPSEPAKMITSASFHPAKSSTTSSSSAESISASSNNEAGAAGWRLVLRRYVPTAIAIYAFTITSVAFAVFSYLECNEVYVDGKKESFVYQYPSVNCASNEYKRYLPLIYSVLVVELILVPLGFLATLVWVKMRQPNLYSEGHNTFYRVFGILFRPFKDRMFFWEIWTIFRRTSLVAVTILSATSSSNQRLVVSTLLCELYLCAHLIFRPFHELVENIAETISLALLSLLGFLLLSMEYPLSDTNRLLAELMVLIPAIVLALWVLVAHRSKVTLAVGRARRVLTSVGGWGGSSLEPSRLSTQVGDATSQAVSMHSGIELQTGTMRNVAEEDRVPSFDAILRVPSPRLVKLHRDLEQAIVPVLDAPVLTVEVQLSPVAADAEQKDGGVP